MSLARGYEEGYRQSIIGLLHNRECVWEVEPIVIGAPWLDHPRNENGLEAVWCAQDYGEILPEDVQEFSRMKEVEVFSIDQWASTMRSVPEQRVKEAVAALLNEPAKSDWGG